MKAFAARNLLASIFLLTIIKATYIKDITLTYEYMNTDFLERENPQIYNLNALNNIQNVLHQSEVYPDAGVVDEKIELAELDDKLQELITQLDKQIRLLGNWGGLFMGVGKDIIPGEFKIQTNVGQEILILLLKIKELRNLLDVCFDGGERVVYLRRLWMISHNIQDAIHVNHSLNCQRKILDEITDDNIRSRIREIIGDSFELFDKIRIGFMDKIKLQLIVHHDELLKRYIVMKKCVEDDLKNRLAVEHAANVKRASDGDKDVKTNDESVNDNSKVEAKSDRCEKKERKDKFLADIVEAFASQVKKVTDNLILRIECARELGLDLNCLVNALRNIEAETTSSLLYNQYLRILQAMVDYNSNDKSKVLQPEASVSAKTRNN